MESAKTYKDLQVWIYAHDLVMEVYALTKLFPDDERFGLTSQLRRASVSVPSNIAEGFSRWGSAEKVRFYNIAEASLAETDYQLYLAGELGYADTNQAQLLGKKLKGLLTNYIKSIRVN